MTTFDGTLSPPDWVAQQIAAAVATVTAASLGAPTTAQMNGAISAAVTAITPAGIGAATPAQVTSQISTAVAQVTAASLGAPTTSQMNLAIAAAIAAIPPAAAVQSATAMSATLKAGVPVGATNLTNGNGTFRMGYIAPAGGISDLELVYDNWSLLGSSGSGANEVGGEQDNPNDLTLKASLEVGTYALPVYWSNGARTLTLNTGSSATTQRIAVEIEGGQPFWVRTYGQWTGTHPASGYGTDAGVVALGASSYGGYTTGSDTSDSIGQMTTSTNNSGILAPSVVRGRLGTAQGVVAILGDSLSLGTGDSQTNGGYIRRGLGNIPNVTLGRGSERASTTAPLIKHARRFRYLSACTSAIEQYFVNDNGNGQALATIQANKILLWRDIARRGVRGWTVTITPSVGNDTTAKETNRVTFNTWVRDGAPITSAGVAAAAGSSAAGTVRFGQPGHPMLGFFEIADLAETARNSGVYKSGYSDDGTHPNAVGAAALAAGIDQSKFATA